MTHTSSLPYGPAASEPAPDGPVSLPEALNAALAAPSPASALKVVQALARASEGMPKKAFTSGAFVSSTLLETISQMKVRTGEELTQKYPDLSPRETAEVLIREAARTTLLLGGAAGAVSSAGALAPPLWVTLPLGPLAATLTTSLVELRLVREIHAIYGIPLDSSPQGMRKLFSSWASGKSSERPENLTEWKDTTQDAFTRLVQRQVLTRLARSVSSLAPMFIGAALGGALAHSGTQRLGENLLTSLEESVS